MACVLRNEISAPAGEGNDLIYRFEIVRRRIRRLFDRSEWLRRLMRLPAHNTWGPGVLLIQLDGLAYDQLKRAISQGRMPFVRRLLQRENYEMTSFYSGQPATTPAVQGELHYNVRAAVPSFGFLDRKAKRFRIMYDHDTVNEVEATLKATGDEPLLKDGSSWVNIYSGGAAADECHFCAASLSPGKMFTWRAIQIGLSIVLLHFAATLRVIFLLFLEVIRSFYDMVKGVLKGESFIKEVKFIISRVFVGTVMREVVQIGAGLDLTRGLPIIHVNFLGYDERSHRRGPGSVFAHAELRRIDDTIKRLYRSAHNSHRRDYQVLLYSDHGQEMARSYEEEHPAGLGQTVYNGLKELDEKIPAKFSVLRDVGSRASWLASPDRVRKFLEAQEQPEHVSPSEEGAFAITARGPLGHIYLDKKMNLEQKRIFADWLVNKGDVPGVLYAESATEIVWHHFKGRTRLPADAETFFPHPDGWRKEIAEDLVRLCHHPNAGDLVLVGWHPERHPWTFPLERGAHGGPGLEETGGFVLLPANTRIPEGSEIFLRPSTLRATLLHILGRKTLPKSKRTRLPHAVRRLRTMTYNVHSCIGLDGNISPERIARVIRGFDPDIVALQEIDLGRARTRRHDQAKMIAEELEMQVAFCCTVQRGDELYGHALLSRFPMEVMKSGLLLGGATGSFGEARGAMLAKIKVDTGNLYVLHSHLGLGRRERVAQVSELLGSNWLGQIGSEEPLIICGDFNTIPGSQAYRALTGRVRDAQTLAKDHKPLNTFTTLLPFSRIDHIFVSPHFEVQQVRVPQSSVTRVASDHLPLIADLSFKPETDS
jgi:endonuclease/exonuclease/phosphatase family metal-dependent hydrolase